MPLSLVFGLGCAAAWGFADFIGGTEARRLPALAVVLWSQVAGGIGLLVALLLLGQEPPIDGMAWGALAGAVGGIALLLFYRGMAVGPLSIVAPISATGAAVPVLVAMVRGEVPAAVQLLGIAAAFAGVVFVSRPPRDRAEGEGSEQAAGRRSAVVLAIAAAVGFGAFFVVVDQGTSVTDVSPVWVIGGVRIGSLALLGSIGALRRSAAPWPGARAPVLALLGVLDTGASVLFSFASVHGNLGVVSVLSVQYPLVTMVLARTVLRERLSPSQLAGAALTLVGVALIAIG